MLNTIMEVFKKPLAPSAEYRDALAKIDIPAAESKLEALEAKRRAVLVQGDDKAIDALDQEIRTANREVDRSYAAKEHLEKLIADAERNEAEGELVASATAARQAADRLPQRYVEIDEAAAKLAELLLADDKDTRLIRRANERFRSSGRLDLLVNDYGKSRLIKHIGGNPMRFVPEWSLPGYWPRLRDSGDMDRALGRAKELL